jgi:hypothetical protein
MRKRGDASVEGRRLKGRYANSIQVGHNALEFVLDFGQLAPETEDIVFHTRIITAPGYAKAFCDTLRKSLTQYEEKFGAIRPPCGDIESEVPRSSRTDTVPVQTE